MKIIKDNPTREQVLAQGGYYGQKGTWNQIYVDPKTKKWLRDRSEMIVIKDGNKIFMRMHGGNKYRLPGGGKEVNKTALEQAIEETKEEARINVKNVKSTGIDWCNVYNTPGEKAKLEGDKEGKLLWYGTHTDLFIGEYDGQYTGEVKKIDRDPDLTKHGEFYPIALVWHMLKPEHREALEKFNYTPVENFIKRIKESNTIGELDAIIGEANKSCISISDTIVIDRATHNKLEELSTHKLENTIGLPNIYPCFTPDEMKSLGVFNEDINLNYYKAESNNEAKEWFRIYEATGNPGSDYNNKITKIWGEFTKNPSNENRQHLLEMGWNPEITFCNENKARAKQLTLEKLNETYNIDMIDLTSINEDGDDLIHNISEVIVPLGKELRKYIKDLIQNNDTFSEINTLYNGYNIQDNMAQELVNSGSTFIIFKYNLMQGDKQKDFDYIKKIQELCNEWLIAKGHLQYRVEILEDKASEILDINQYGIVALQQRTVTGDVDYIQESVSEQFTIDIINKPIITENVITETTVAPFKLKDGTEIEFIDAKSKEAEKYMSKYDISRKNKYPDHFTGFIAINKETKEKAGWVFVWTRWRFFDKYPGNLISPIEVVEKYRKQGLGKKLLSIAINNLKGNILGVDTYNTVAINMYKKAGFKELETVKDKSKKLDCYIMAKGKIEPIEEFTILENKIDDKLYFASTVDEFAAAVVAPVVPVVHSQDAKEEYDKKVKDGEYTGDPELDYCESLGEQVINGISRKQILSEVCNKLKELGKVEDVNRKAYLGFLTRECSSLNIYSGDDAKEICQELNSSLNNSHYTIIESAYNTLTIITNKHSFINESFILTEATLDRKQILDKVKSLFNKYNYPLKISKKGYWGEEKFLTGEKNLVFLTSDLNYKKIVRTINKDLKGVDAHLKTDNYHTVFLVVKKNVAVSEDTILEAVHKKKLHPVYIVNSFTNTNFGKVITKFTGDTYSHSAIALDGDLENLYSYNAGNNHNLLGGFSIESITNYKNKSDISRVQINAIFVGDKAYNTLKNIIENLKLNISNTAYNFGNLFNVIINREDKHQDVNNMICSQFVDNILKAVNVDLTQTASNLVTPGKLSRVNNPKVYKLYEGLLSEFDYKKFKIKVTKIMKGKVKVIAETRIRQFLEFKPVLEAKEFPVQFDDDGNLLIKNRKKLDYNAEWKKTKKLRKYYQEHNNILAMKYEAAKCWYLAQCIEYELNEDFKHSKYTKEDLVLYRSRILTEFSQYMKSILKVQDDFNFTAYYNSTPFSDDQIEISANTLKYSSSYIKSILKNIL